MPLELLASIKGATSSEDVDALFEIIKQAGANETGSTGVGGNAVSTGALREDVVVHATATEKELIRKNFPSEKNGYLVVPKVIED